MAKDNEPYLYALHGWGRVILTLLLILLGLCLISISAIGLAALANSLGQRIRKADPSSNSKLIGATLLVLSGLVPFLGWFIVTPVSLCIGFGSTIQTLFQRSTNPKVLE
jgi:hypothetical protein